MSGRIVLERWYKLTNKGCSKGKPVDIDCSFMFFLFFFFGGGSLFILFWEDERLDEHLNIPQGLKPPTKVKFLPSSSFPLFCLLVTSCIFMVH